MLAIDFEKRLGSFQLQPLFEAPDELIVLLGPSGAGKSLTLGAIAGLVRPDKGRIELPGGVVFDSTLGINRLPQQRGVGYVMQNLALFPHLSVAENIAFALNGWPAQQQRQRVAELVALLGLQGLEARRPREISGGQQQRVALGRALAGRPRVLLLDEPFSALDAPIRNALRREVARLQRQLGLLTIFVTHDLHEAYALADWMAVYNDGAVLQFGRRDDVFRHPATDEVARLLDSRNIIRGTVLSSTPTSMEVRTPWFVARAAANPELSAGDSVAICIRPEHVLLQRRDRSSQSETDTVLDVELVDEEATGNSHRLFLKVVAESGSSEPCILEAEISAHPYQVMGIGTRRDWRVALPLEYTVATRLAD